MSNTVHLPIPFRSDEEKSYVKKLLHRYHHCQLIKKIILAIQYGSKLYHSSYLPPKDYYTMILNCCDNEKQLEKWVENRYQPENDIVYGFNADILKMGDLCHFESHIVEVVRLMNKGCYNSAYDLRALTGLPYNFYNRR